MKTRYGDKILDYTLASKVRPTTKWIFFAHLECVCDFESPESHYVA